MKLDKNLQKNEGESAGSIGPSDTFSLFLEREINNTEDLRKNLGTEYDKSSLDKIERNLAERRNELKGRLKDITNPDHEFINRSDLRKKFTEEAIQKYTRVAENIQEARESEKLNRPKTTDAIEDLGYALKNLKHLIFPQSKK
jgi:hypothetical protein